MATRVLLLVMMTGLFAALWSGDRSETPSVFARRPAEQRHPAEEREPASIAKPVAPGAEQEEEDESGEAAAQVNCSHHQLAEVAVSTLYGMNLREQARLELVSAPAMAEDLLTENGTQESAGPESRELPLEGSELDAELFAEVVSTAVPAEDVSAGQAAPETTIDLFTDCELPLPEVMSAGEYRIVKGNGQVLVRTFSPEDLTWLGVRCEGGTELCRQVEADGAVWHFIRVNVKESRQPAPEGQQIVSSEDEALITTAPASEPAVQREPVVARRPAAPQDIRPDVEASLEVERARAQWLLTGWQLGCQVDWMLRRLNGATRSPGQMLWTAGVRLQQQLAARQSSAEDRLTESPRADETR